MKDAIILHDILSQYIITIREQEAAQIWRISGIPVIPMGESHSRYSYRYRRLPSRCSSRSR